MILGVPKETLKNETRVAVIPATVKQLISAGFDIFIESGAGDLSQISDSEYTKSGAKIFNTANLLQIKSYFINKKILFVKSYVIDFHYVLIKIPRNISTKCSTHSYV